ncbi:MAG: hypothetical protein GW938_16910, partial [Leptospira sp.]|nr:hypothetical protein [Leptospira sp.]
ILISEAFARDTTVSRALLSDETLMNWKEEVADSRKDQVTAEIAIASPRINKRMENAIVRK